MCRVWCPHLHCLSPRGSPVKTWPQGVTTGKFERLWRVGGSSVSSRIIHQERQSLGSQRQGLFPSCSHFPITRDTHPFSLLQAPCHDVDCLTIDQKQLTNWPWTETSKTVNQMPILNVCNNRKLTTTDHKIMPRVIRFSSVRLSKYHATYHTYTAFLFVGSK